MSDEKGQFKDEELDQVSGGGGRHMLPVDPPVREAPPTHPGLGDNPVGGKRSNIAGG